MRSFGLALFIALAALMATAQAADTSSAGAEKLGWKLTLQSWTTHGTVASSIGYAKQLGLHYIEIYPGQELSDKDKGKWGPEMTDAQIKEMNDIAKAAGVKIIDTGVIGISSNEAEARKLFDWAKKVGITEIVSEPEEKALPMIDKIAGEYHIKVALHDHPKPSRYWDPDYTFDHIKDLKNIGFCADVGHWKRSGLEPVDVLKKYGDRVFSLHFKDLKPDNPDKKDLKPDNPDKKDLKPDKKGWHDVVWGTGDSKAAEMLEVLKRKNFKGPIAIEYEAKWDVPTLQKCVDFFNEQANALAK
ncbi:MAG TPA: sugar phosphate isomerase/epimerase [Pirellulales bacterium]|jgi:sugar phosphate isomerase/epimerase|nr:sugar phosphate isomerase/epimerase [Pirellulales bacterium]